MTAAWILPNTSSFWKVIWNKNWTKLSFFSMTEQIACNKTVSGWWNSQRTKRLVCGSIKCGQNYREAFVKRIHAILKSSGNSVTENGNAYLWRPLTIFTQIFPNVLKSLFKVKEVTRIINNIHYALEMNIIQ